MKNQEFVTMGVGTWEGQTFNMTGDRPDLPDYPGYMESGDYLNKFCEEQNFTYYAAPAEEYRYGGETQAISEARKNGFNGIILEDLS